MFRDFNFFTDLSSGSGEFSGTFRQVWVPEKLSVVGLGVAGWVFSGLDYVTENQQAVPGCTEAPGRRTAFRAAPRHDHSVSDKDLSDKGLPFCRLQKIVQWGS